jgi:hypothetical protein
MRRKHKKQVQDREPMKNVTLSMPAHYDICIDTLKEQGVVSSRSGAIRQAIAEFIEEEYLLFLPLIRSAGGDV